MSVILSGRGSFLKIAGILLIVFSLLGWVAANNLANRNPAAFYAMLALSAIGQSVPISYVLAFFAKSHGILFLLAGLIIFAMGFIGQGRRHDDEYDDDYYDDDRDYY